MRRKKSEVTIDETEHIEAPAITQRFKHALVSVGLGIILVQVYYFWGAFKSGNFSLGISVVTLFDNVYFLVYLAICAVMGWWLGQKYIERMHIWISYWKFW